MILFGKIFKSVGRVVQQAAPIAIGFLGGGPAGAVLAAARTFGGDPESPLLGAAIQSIDQGSSAPIKDYSAAQLVRQWAPASPYIADERDYYDEGGEEPYDEYDDDESYDT